MRFVLVALVLAGCSHGPATSSPANKLAAPDYNAAAADELGFLPSHTDIVMGLDISVMRRSQLWHSFEPQFDAMLRQMPSYGGCGTEVSKQLEKIAMSIKILGGKRFSGVFVLRGRDMQQALDCSVAETKKKGGFVTVDRGVTVTTGPPMPSMTAAMTLVGPSTLVMQFDAVANHDTLTAVLASGAPLRQSPVFMKLYERRERGASLWGMANGNAKLFDQMASSGLRPRAVDGTFVLTDRLTMTVRMDMESVGQATTIAGEIDKLKSMAGNYAERIDVGVESTTAQVAVTMNEMQIRQLIQMAGSLGP